MFQIADRLQAHKWDVLDPDNFSFIIVRHPLDRLISAFTDRILNTDTGQVGVGTEIRYEENFSFIIAVQIPHTKNFKIWRDFSSN